MLSALGNHLWQSTVFAGAAGLLVAALRRQPARVRHAIWLAASVKFLAPFAIFIGLGGQVGSRTAPVVAAPAQVSRAVVEMAEPITVSGARAGRPAPILAIWACGFLAVAGSFAWRRRRVGRMVRSASPVEMPLPIETRVTTAPIEPGVFGIFHPVLLLPEGISNRLSPDEFRAILAHELCHARRRDNLAALVHMAVEAIFWFHPVVWFIGARLVEERERACDEEVVRLGNQPEVYAGSILSACRLYLESPASCVSGVTGADLRRRVERIMTEGMPARLGTGGKALIAAASFLAIAGPLAIGLLHAQGGPAFEVASVKANKSSGAPGRIGSPSRGRFMAENVALPIIVATAYDVNMEQIAGWPEWAMGERFDIDAKPEHPASREEMTAMLRTLLAERFKLRVRRETREQQIYALAVDKNGPRFKAHPQQAGVEATRPEMPIRPGDKGQVIFNGVEMSRLAWFLGTRLRGRVIDRTGLAGLYDFELAWPGERFQESPDGALAIDSGPSLFAALREQLGLKLESERGPVEYLTVEHVERPTEN